MANQGTQSEGEWSSNKEMNVQGNSSVVEDTDDIGGESSWRPGDDDSVNIQPSENPTGAGGQSPASQTQTGDPGRTPGKAEGEDDSE